VVFPSPLGSRSSKTKSISGIKLPSHPKTSSEPNSDPTNKPASTSSPERASKGDSDIEAFKLVHIQTPTEQTEQETWWLNQPFHMSQKSINQHETYLSKLLEYSMLKKTNLRTKLPKPPTDFEPDWHSNAGNTALHIASAEGDINLIRQLKTIGANVARQNDKGETPLM